MPKIFFLTTPRRVKCEVVQKNWQGFALMITETSSMRWIVLVLSCLMLFGNYYAFDNPSSLNRQLREFLGSSPENFQFELNLLYSVYSIPNVVLPLILGAILDRFGHRQMINLLSAFVVVGQVIFTIGAMVKNFPVMLIGRVFFGIGGESLGVAQTKLMTDWFRGKELAFAMGLTVSVGTVGTVANNLLSPYFASAVSVPFALWVGTFLCILSFFSSVWTTFIDKKYRAHLLNISMGINFLTEEHELTAPLTDTSEKADEPLLQKPRKGNNFHPAFWLLTLITFLLYVRIFLIIRECLHHLTTLLQIFCRLNIQTWIH